MLNRLYQPAIVDIVFSFFFSPFLLLLLLKKRLAGYTDLIDIIRQHEGRRMLTIATFKLVTSLVENEGEKKTQDLIYAYRVYAFWKLAGTEILC